MHTGTINGPNLRHASHRLGRLPTPVHLDGDEPPVSNGTDTPRLNVALFDGDFFRRATSRLGFRRDGLIGALGYVALPVLVSWPPVLLLNLLHGGADIATIREFAVLDLAGTVQFLVVLPILMWAEFVIDSHASTTGIYLGRSGLVSDPAKVAKQLWRIDRIRRGPAPDLVCVLIAYVVSLLMIGSELASDAPIATWRLTVNEAGRPQLLLAGWYYGLVSLPVLNYFWSRWAAKILVWSLYLRTLAKADLGLIAGHPDRAGGLGLLGDMQARFGLVIFSIGLMIAATAIHRSVIEGHSLDSFNTWSIVAGFAIAAPLAFVAPLLSFTSALRRVKTAGLVAYASQAARRLSAFERGTPVGGSAKSDVLDDDENLPAMEDLAICYENVVAMRSLPLDYRSTLQLLCSAAGPMLPLVPKLIPWKALQEITTALLG